MNLLQHAYDILALSPDASPQELHCAYRELVKVWHPDRFGDDPRLQNRAEEKLKQINEAYTLVREDLACRLQRSETPGGALSSVTSPPVSAPGFHSPKPENKSNTPETPPAWPSPPAAPLLPFFSAWQNLIFLIFVAALLHNATVRYGTMFAGAGYALKMLALPLLFAMLCNLPRFASRRLLWGSYVAVVSLFGVLVMVDDITFSNQLHEATLYRSATPLESGGGVGDYPGGLPAGSSPGPFSVTAGRSSSGPMSPLPPQVLVPEAPQAPAAPIVPAAPVAQPAR